MENGPTALVQCLSILFVCTLLLVTTGRLPFVQSLNTLSAYAVLLVASGQPPLYSGFGAGPAVYRGPGQQPYICQISLQSSGADHTCVLEP